MPALALLSPTSHLSTYLKVTHGQPCKTTIRWPGAPRVRQPRTLGREEAMCSLNPGFPSPHRVGRRKVLTWSCLQLAVSGACTAFTPNFTAYCARRFLSSVAMSGITTNSLTLSERGPGRAGLMGTLESQRFSGPGGQTNSDLSSFPEYKDESTCPSIPPYQGLPWGRQGPGQKEMKMMTSLVALIFGSWNASQIFRDH